MLKSLRNLYRGKKGATAVEYGIMVAAIAAVIIAIVFVIGGQVNDAFVTVSPWSMSALVMVMTLKATKKKMVGGST